jgi:outer membrane murein-binding lipoprotein Lpp
VRGNPDNLRQAAARKSAAAQTRAETALREMIRRHQPITFRGLAHNAGVSLDFLYRHPNLRRRVEHLRGQQDRPSRPIPVAAPDEPSSVVRTLTAQITELKRQHRADIDALNQALQAAHGENLALRRQLGRRAGSQPSATLTDASASALPAQTRRS